MASCGEYNEFIYTMNFMVFFFLKKKKNLHILDFNYGFLSKGLIQILKDQFNLLQRPVHCLVNMKKWSTEKK